MTFKLNEQQQRAFDAMIKGKSIFLSGSAGTGKSMLIKKFYSEYSHLLRIAITSTTGVSAVILGGKTLHSYLGIGLGTTSKERLAFKIKKGIATRNRWQKLDVLIVDEISMLSPELFDKLEYIARVVREKDTPFGGIQLILSGDFLQLPVVGSDKLCFEADTWNNCIDDMIYLTEIMRQRDTTFQECLNEIRIGNISEKSKSILKSITNKKLSPQFGIQPTIIYTTNESVDLINNEELYKLNEEGSVEDYYDYKMATFINKNLVPESIRDSFIEKFTKSIPAKAELTLCVDAQVMLLCNSIEDDGLSNGSRGIITEFVDGIPKVKFLNGVEKIVSFHTWSQTDDYDNVLIGLTQIPLKLAWCLTVHSCQGQTIDYAIVNLSRVFTYSQVYVAISRVKDLNGLSITNLNLNTIKANPKALQFYNDILQRDEQIKKYNNVKPNVEELKELEIEPNGEKIYKKCFHNCVGNGIKFYADHKYIERYFEINDLNPEKWCS